MDAAWHAGPLAQSVVTAEAALLQHALEDIFGFELLQLGDWAGSRRLLSGARTRHQAVLAPCPGAGVDVVSQLTHLPAASSSIDAVLLPHTLEFAADPHAILREVDRVLAGDGRLVVLGFRPRSPWGWRAAASRGAFPPGSLRLLSEGRLRDWLNLLGYDMDPVQHYLYRLPLVPRAADDATARRSLRRGWFYPLPAGAYLLKARKRLYGLTPIRPRKRERRALLGSALEPSA